MGDYLKQIQTEIVLENIDLGDVEPEESQGQIPNIPKHTLEQHSRSLSHFITNNPMGSNATEKQDEERLQRMRALVQERLALIIQHEILNRSRDETLTPNTKDEITIRFPRMKQVMEEWLIPRGIKDSFMVVTAMAYMTVGKNGIKRGDLFKLTPFEFQRMFMPVVANMESSTQMHNMYQTWLASTQALSEKMDWNTDYL